MFTYEIVLCGLRVSNHDEHFVVDVFVSDGLAILVSRSPRHYSVILDLEAAILLADDNHGLRVSVQVLRLRADGDEFNIVLNPQYLAPCLCFYILLRNVLRLIVKEPVGVTRPRDASHVHLILGHV